MYKEFNYFKYSSYLTQGLIYIAVRCLALPSTKPTQRSCLFINLFVLTILPECFPTECSLDIHCLCAYHRTRWYKFSLPTKCSLRANAYHWKPYLHLTCAMSLAITLCALSLWKPLRYINLFISLRDSYVMTWALPMKLPVYLLCLRPVCLWWSSKPTLCSYSCCCRTCLCKSSLTWCMNSTKAPQHISTVSNETVRFPPSNLLFNCYIRLLVNCLCIDTLAIFWVIPWWPLAATPKRHPLPFFLAVIVFFWACDIIMKAFWINSAKYWQERLQFIDVEAKS